LDIEKSVDLNTFNIKPAKSDHQSDQKERLGNNNNTEQLNSRGKGLVTENLNDFKDNEKVKVNDKDESRFSTKF